jgi:decaprenylphospho-beta-D-ribofuranose 2-oxidase
MKNTWIRIWLSLFFLGAPQVLAQQVVFQDVTTLKPVHVYKVVEVRGVEDIRNALQEAKSKGLKISIAGRRHAQGGQQSYPNGIVLDMMTFNKILSLDLPKKIVRVQSGVTWGQIQAAIDPYGLSLKVMAIRGITVGGALSSNIHGNDANYGAIIETINSFRLMGADGQIRNVSREENSELFSLAIGGYGLFGVIIDVDISLTENTFYRREIAVTDYKEYPKLFKSSILGHADIGRFEGRFLGLEQGMLNTIQVTLWRKSEDGRFRKGYKSRNAIFAYPFQPPGQMNSYINMTGEQLFYGIGCTGCHSVTKPDNSISAAHKRTPQWLREQLVSPQTHNPQTSMPSYARLSERNIRLLIEYLQGMTIKEHPLEIYLSQKNPAKPLMYYDFENANVYQEYFIPVKKFIPFIDGLQEIFGKEGIKDLIGVTFRYLPKDTQSFLPYAKTDSIAICLDIKIDKDSPKLKKDRQLLTQDVIDLALKNGGTYYLTKQFFPATKKQLLKAYPRFNAFIKKKKYYDPQGVFYNQFFENYANSKT